MPWLPQAWPGPWNAPRAMALSLVCGHDHLHVGPSGVGPSFSMDALRHATWLASSVAVGDEVVVLYEGQRTSSYTWGPRRVVQTWPRTCPRRPSGPRCRSGPRPKVGSYPAFFRSRLLIDLGSIHSMDGPVVDRPPSPCRPSSPCCARGGCALMPRLERSIIIRSTQFSAVPCFP